MGGTTVVTSHKLCAGLIAYWKCDETSASTLYDVFNVNNITLGGSAVPGATGKISYAADFVAAGDSGTIPSTILTDKIYDKLTISIWVKFDTLSSVLGRTQYLINLCKDTTGATAASIFLNTSNELYYDASYIGLSNSYTYDSGWTDTTNFHHVVAVTNGIGSAIKLYIDGSDVSERVYTPTAPFSPFTYRATIGNGNISGSTALDGKLDEIGIWNRNLSPTEITQLYNSGSGLTYPFTS